MPEQPTTAFVPYLSVQDARKAIEFYSEVFGCEPHVCLSLPDGRIMHCEYRIGAAKLFLSDELPEHGGTPSPTSTGNTTVAVHVYVEDCDATTSIMQKLGATVLLEPQDMFWGERFSRVQDPFGHIWGIATLLETMTPEAIEAAAKKLLSGSE